MPHYSLELDSFLGSVELKFMADDDKTKIK
jgi:hypothetical protein